MFSEKNCMSADFHLFWMHESLGERLKWLNIGRYEKEEKNLIVIKWNIISATFDGDAMIIIPYFRFKNRLMALR